MFRLLFDHEPLLHLGLSFSAPTKPAVSTASAAVPVKRIRRQSAPDHDVVYRVNMPQGTTVRSRQLLDKAAAIKKKAIAKKSSVFDRLGAVVKSDQDDDDCDEEEESPRLSALPARLRKSVSFACGTKESTSCYCLILKEAFLDKLPLQALPK